ncbi:tyrosinase co-factor [Streptomyces hygroscopicus subsp. jinggangensis 5008]|uniref:tyrosinase family oxidase copper chaperone n=1 Tax=Streptomyces olivaceoviridis TaxID=1921 RepID=UPI00024BCB5A|nr:tyrosinase co-factor [Streptomyces hygroscopicus subsp. jinggangensis 5008]AGF63629.1 tyrosinase co-factor [Streptomyces hygroscopicus subsp. jinggangensis TL01]ALO93896.1 Tyrosinase co-factor [Streptomyces hygroscopicus subsp. limoneus]
MVVGVGAVAVGAEQQAGTGAARPSRREVARRLLASTAALGLAPVVAASRPAPSAGGSGGGSFDETYRGRRIQGVLVPAAAPEADGGEWRITVDGRPLHLMRRADGTWLSMVDHYTSYRTPLEATRAAVDEIGPGRELRDLAPGRLAGGHPGGHAHTGGQHGVRA